jgi:hypothetical protein
LRSAANSRPDQLAHHDVEAPRVDDRHFRPAWRVLTRLDALLADKAITAAEWHAAADYRELWDRVGWRAFTRSSAFGTVRAAGNSSARSTAPHPALLLCLDIEPGTEIASSLACSSAIACTGNRPL